MIDAEADPTCNRMNITSDQELTDQGLKSLNEKIRLESAHLQSGWVAAVDLRRMWVNDPFLNERLQGLQRTLLDCGAGKIGTLLDSDAIRMRLGQAGLKTRSNQITQRFYDAEEWEDFLAR